MKKRAEWYDRIFAAIYDPILAGVERRTFSRLRSRLLFGIRGTVLDLGAGTGANIPYLDGPDHRTVFLDRSLPMIQKGVEKDMRSKGFPVIGSAMSLPFADEVFHSVVVSLVLCSVEDLSESFQEIDRVLRQEGTLFLMEHVRATHPVTAALQKFLSPLWKVMAGGCHLDRQTDHEVRRLFTEEDSWIEKIGGIPFHMGRYRKRVRH